MSDAAAVPDEPVLVLVGMSVREVEARARLLTLVEPYRGRVAFLQSGDPSLGRMLTELADAGVEEIDLVGVSLGTLAPAASWLRRIAAFWWRERAQPRPVVRIASRLLTEPAEPESLPDVRESLRPVHGAEAGLASPAWEDVPGHRHQVLVCRGPRCTAQGSDRTAEAMILELMRLGLGDEDVLITHTGCLSPCNQAPVVCIQPDDAWYGGVDQETARRIAAEHVAADRPVSAARLPRSGTAERLTPADG